METKEFTGRLPAFESRNCIPLGVSPDAPEKHRRFRAKHDLKITLLADPGLQMMADYGASKGKGVLGIKALGVRRSSVLLDPDGKVAFHWPEVNARGHAGEVLDKLEELGAG